MSAVQDEAEAGHTDPIFESKASPLFDESSDDDFDGLQPPSRVTDSIKEARGINGEEQDPISNGRTVRGYAKQEQDEAFLGERGKAAPSPVQERPSSADGSLSTPDDTPSLQVTMLHLHNLPCLTDLEFGSFISRWPCPSL